MNGEPQMMTASQFAAALGLTVDAVYAMVRRGVVRPASRFGRAYQFDRAELARAGMRRGVGRPRKLARSSVA
jgi:excisionase family DNA binding protein